PELREIDDAAVESVRLPAPEPEDRGAEEDVFAARELGMEADAQLEHRRDRARHLHAAQRGPQDAGHDPEESALARAVRAHETERLTAVEVQVHVAQGPHVLAPLAVPGMEEREDAYLEVEGGVVPEDESLRD